MRIAIPTDDQSTLSAHTGKCAGFLIYTLNGNQFAKEEYRPNTVGRVTLQAFGEVQEEHHHHDHTELIRLLCDCQTLLVRGIGPGLLRDMQAEGMNVIMTYEPDITRALESFVHGQTIRDQPRSMARH